MTTNAYPEVAAYWRGIVGTLAQRRLLRQRQDGAKVIPEAVAIVEAERVSFVLDMLRLGGVSRESWLDRALWAQLRAALKGRRVYVADSGGLAVVVARQPGEVERKRLRSRVLLSPDMIPAGEYTALLGESVHGPVVFDFAEGERAVLVGGTSGSGKTGTIRSLILQLARKNDPQHYALAIVDLKQLDFPLLSGLPHLVRDVATTEGDACELVAWCEQEMRRRQAVMVAAGVTRWDLLPEGERLPLLQLVIDEAADFERSRVMVSLVELARKSRACGISLIAATQRPDADVFSPQAKANFSTRVAFRTVDRSNSQVILDRGGAQDLRRTGHCIVRMDGRYLEAQAAYIPDDDLGDWATAPTTSPLSDVEVELVEYALAEFEGAFKVNGLYVVFGDRISKYALQKLAKAWELRGWLTSPTRNNGGHNVGRMVTDELVRIASSGLVTTLVTENTPSSRLNTLVTTSRFNGQGVGEGDIPPFLAERFGK